MMPEFSLLEFELQNSTAEWILLYVIGTLSVENSIILMLSDKATVCTGI